MPEEIFVRCVYCNRTFNVEWQGIELTPNETGVCSKKQCQKEHKQHKARTEQQDKMRGY